jgi:4-amino-4-deoxy-L-arabinose transferase-like glycosyltransferase
MSESAAVRRPPLAVPSLSWGQRTSLVVLAASLLHGAFAAATGLTDTEAYYAQWARFPSLSYYDHPPLIAWTTWLAGHVVGSSAALRIGPVFYAAVFDALLYRLAVRLFTPRAGFYAVVLVNALPVFGFTGFLLNPEAALAPLWVLVLLLLLDLRDHDEAYRPVAVAFAIGVAFLAKYTAILAIPVALLCVVACTSWRRWVRRPSFYISALVAIPVAAPVIVWNALRGWPSVHLHLVERAHRAVAESLAQGLWRVERGQLFFFQPVLQPALLAVLGTTLVKAKRDDRYRFLATASLPVLAFLFAMMIRVHDSEPQWTMVGYVPLLIAAGGLLDEGTGAPRRASHVLFHLGVSTSVVVGVAFGVQLSAAMKYGTLPSYNPSADLLRETVGWGRVKAAVESHVAKLGSATVVAGAHNVFCGHLQMALDDSPAVYCVAARLTHFDFIGRRHPPPEAPVVFVDSDRDPQDPAALMPDYDCSRGQEIEVMQERLFLTRYRVRDCVARTVAGSR